MKLLKSLRERLYTFLNRVNQFGLNNNQLVVGVELLSTMDKEIRIFGIRRNKD